MSTILVQIAIKLLVIFELEGLGGYSEKVGFSGNGKLGVLSG